MKTLSSFCATSISTLFALSAFLRFAPCPGLPEYQLGSPVFTKVTMHLPNGKDFTIEAPGSTRDAKYVAKAELDGRPIAGTSIPHAAVVGGQTLRLEMTE